MEATQNKPPLDPKKDPWKGKRGKRGPKRFRYTYADIARLLGVSIVTAKAYAHRGKYDPNDVVSLAKFWAKRRKV